MPRKRLYKPQSRKTDPKYNDQKSSPNPLDTPAPRQKISYSKGEIELLDRLKTATGYKTRSKYIHDVSLGYKPPSNDMTRQTDRILIALNELMKDLRILSNNMNQIAARTNTNRSLHPQDAIKLADALSTMPEIKKEIALAAQLVVSMSCPTLEGDVSDP